MNDHAWRPIATIPIGLLQSLHAPNIDATATTVVQQSQGPQPNVRLRSVVVRLGSVCLTHRNVCWSLPVNLIREHSHCLALLYALNALNPPISLWFHQSYGNLAWSSINTPNSNHTPSPAPTPAHPCLPYLPRALERLHHPQPPRPSRLPQRV